LFLPTKTNAPSKEPESDGERNEEGEGKGGERRERCEATGCPRLLNRVTSEHRSMPNKLLLKFYF
jgi:hypothetical protein